jgi:hypothetical protein
MGGLVSKIFGGGGKKAAKKANALQTQIYNDGVQRFDPIIQSGNNARSMYDALLGTGGDREAADNAFAKYLDSSGYKFQLDQGSQAITGNKAAAGLLNSGSTLKALNKYGQDLGSSFFDRFLSLLGNQQVAGQNAAGALTGAGQNYANAYGQNLWNRVQSNQNAFSNILSLGTAAVGAFAGGGAPRGG